MTLLRLEGLDGGFIMEESSRERLSVDRRWIEVGLAMEDKLGEDVDIGADGRISGGAMAAIDSVTSVHETGRKCWWRS